MKSVTEFPSFVLSQALQVKNALAAEGKTPEEIQTSLGEKYKYEGDKLKHFTNALDVAGQNQENLKRVLVVSLNEGENAPAKATKVDEFHYVPEFMVLTRPVADGGDRRGGKGGRGGKGRGERGPKSSPWGMSPEEKALKNKGAAAKTEKPS